MTSAARGREETSGAGGWTIAGPLTLVVDFDGTITEENTLHLVVERFGDARALRADDSRLGRGVTLEEVIARAYGSVRASREDVVRWLEERVHVRGGFRELAELCTERGWRLVIVSSGVRELVEPLLAREGLTGIELVSNRLGKEWDVRFLEAAPCEICGELCKRKKVLELRDGRDLVYVGDGYSDGCAALTADRVFARARLANFLSERHIRFEPFEDFVDVATSLSEDPPKP